MWPFGSKSSGTDRDDDRDAQRGSTAVTSADSADSATAATSAASGAPASGPDAATAPAGTSDTAGSAGSAGSAGTADAAGASYDPVNGSYGPFDGDRVDYREFDFSDFAKGGLDLGSMMVPVPHQGEVQVEMGPQGPQMIHIVTPVGRVTPVAFAAPRSGGLWEESLESLEEGMVNDGLATSRGTNLWGEEIIGTAGNGRMRVIGVDGPRWMLRVTLAGPAETADELASLAYDLISRTFVNRGDAPVPAGSPLPVTIPAAMAEELKRAVEQQNQQAQQAQAQQNQAQQNQAQQPAAPAGPVDHDADGPARPARRNSGTADGRMGDAG
ncbi:DUF3710 domain-containing protein [Corynebacterium nuruki]|uniref:DUF3710 domain-containing protein n=1 Tax=Corynebacterium nuruki TaxID=1032851 RepID=UPI00235342AC